MITVQSLLDVFKYITPLSLTNLFLGKLWLENIINDVLRKRNIQRLITLPLYPGLLELYNVRYTEKWVKKIDENFLEYHSGSRPLLNFPTYPLPRNLKYLSTKFFSGDVSGMIAESLFIYLLDHLGVNVNLVGHLRPYKRGRAAFLPDFVIWDRSLVTTPLISTSNCQLPIYAEVKGSTCGVNERQLQKALCQLSKVIYTSQDRGLIFIAYKNPNYEGIIFEVEQ
jgi:hypothetical protein